MRNNGDGHQMGPDFTTEIFSWTYIVKQGVNWTILEIPIVTLLCAEILFYIKLFILKKKEFTLQKSTNLLTETVWQQAGGISIK